MRVSRRAPPIYLLAPKQDAFGRSYHLSIRLRRLSRANGQTVVKQRIYRDKGRLLARKRRVLLCAAVGLGGLWVMPLWATRPPASSITISLDAAKPLEGSDDLATVLGIGAPAAVDAAFDPASLSPFAQGDAGAFVPPSQFATGPAASPYVFQGRTPTDNLRALMCLTAAIYYEAANEPDDGQRAVAQVVINRVRHPAYPNTVCDVVYQGTERNDTLCQFTFGCDGALARKPMAAPWLRARRVAAAALSGSVFAPVGLATNYHTLAVSPTWGRTLTPTGIFGAHIFYRLPGGAGEPRSFHANYSGREPVPGPRAKLPLPAVTMAANAPLPFPQTSVPGTFASNAREPITAAATAAPKKSVASDRRYLPGALPESEINPAYRSSGEWIRK